MLEEINYKLLSSCGSYLQKNKLSLALAESMTGGFMSSIWSMEQNSGCYLQGGIVTYQPNIKEQFLGVPSAIIDVYTAESIQTTQYMVEGLVERFQCDVGIAITGLAYEGSQPHPTANVGDTFICIFFRGHYHQAIIHLLETDAGKIYVGAMNYSLQLLASCIDDAEIILKGSLST